jgi:hypothetical protein
MPPHQLKPAESLREPVENLEGIPTRAKCARFREGDRREELQAALILAGREVRKLNTHGKGGGTRMFFLAFSALPGILKTPILT